MRLPPRLRAELARLAALAERLEALGLRQAATELRQAISSDDPTRVIQALLDTVDLLTLRIDELAEHLERLKSAKNE